MSGYGNYGGQNPYGQAPAAEAGYSQPYSQYGQQTQNQYEMQPVGGYGNNHTEAPPAAAAAAAPRTLTQQDYLARVGYVRDQIRSLTADIEEVGALHQRALGSTDEQAARDRDNLVAATQLRNTEIRDQIRQLELDFAKTTDGTRATKKAQLESVRSLFKSELDRYQTIERDYQRRYRDQIKRQFRIAYPDASEQEVEEAAVQDWGNEGVFQNALRTNRGAQASSVLGNVRARHNELLRIEQTMNELALLSAEMAQLIEQQAPVVAAAEANAQDTVQNLQEGNKQVVIASKHARNRRKLKWWCLFITILIIVIAVGVGVGVYEANHKTT